MILIQLFLPKSLMKRIRLEIGIRIRYLGLMRMSYFGLLRVRNYSLKPLIQKENYHHQMMTPQR